MNPKIYLNKLLVILGPTAAGKTDLALSLAKKFNGELVSCDSRQVYQGLDIGTGKLTGKNSKFEMIHRPFGPRNSKLRKQNGQWIVNGINIWMYDVVDVNTLYTVADYVKDAEEVIEGIREGGKLPIVVGGTGLYLRALLYGLSNLNIPVDKKLREELEKLTLEELKNKLQALSPTRWENLNESDRQNSRRLLRSIEVVSMNPYIQTKNNKGVSNNSDVLKIGLTAPKEFLYKKADQAVFKRINQGMIKEAENLQKVGLTLNRMRQLGLEYGVLADYLEEKILRQELIKKMQGKIHGFIRRQLTWFKKEKDINWFDISEKNIYDNVEKKIAKWYYSRNAAQD